MRVRPQSPDTSSCELAERVAVGHSGSPQAVGIVIAEASHPAPDTPDPGVDGPDHEGTGHVPTSDDDPSAFDEACDAIENLESAFNSFRHAHDGPESGHMPISDDHRSAFDRLCETAENLIRAFDSDIDHLADNPDNDGLWELADGMAEIAGKIRWWTMDAGRCPIGSCGDQRSAVPSLAG